MASPFYCGVNYKLRVTSLGKNSVLGVRGVMGSSGLVQGCRGFKCGLLCFACANGSFSAVSTRLRGRFWYSHGYWPYSGTIHYFLGRLFITYRVVVCRGVGVIGLFFIICRVFCYL